MSINYLNTWQRLVLEPMGIKIYKIDDISIFQSISNNSRVYKAFSRSDSAIYALKKLIIYKEKEGQKGKEYEKEGVISSFFKIFLIYLKFPITALREIKFLQNLDHQNIIKLHQVVISSCNFHFICYMSIYIYVYTICIYM